MSIAPLAPQTLAASTETPKLRERISIRSLNFFYGEVRALKDITLALYQGRITAFIGPSGCGKSTLLRVLNRMYDLYPNQRAEGEVLFDGEEILAPGQDLNLLRARIGMVFQKPTPFPMSIYENIAFGLNSMKNCRNPSSMGGSRRRCAAPRCGKKSRTSWPPTA